MSETETKNVQREERVIIKQNGIKRPEPGSVTGRLWDIADEISRERGEPAPRAAVVERYMNELPKANKATANTQYARWVQYYGVRDQIRALRTRELEAQRAESAEARAARLEAKKAEKEEKARLAAEEKERKRVEREQAKAAADAEKQRVREERAAAKAAAKAEAEAAKAAATETAASSD